MANKKKKIIIEIPWYKHYTKLLIVLVLFMVAVMAVIGFLSPKQADIIGIEDTTIATTTTASVPSVPTNSNDILGQPVVLLPFGLTVYTWMILIVGFALMWKFLRVRF